MRSFSSLWKGPASRRLVNLAVKTSVALVVAALVTSTTPWAFAQNANTDQRQEQTWGDTSIPLVYHVENTGAGFPAPDFPTFAKLPIVRTLPDPFVSTSGFRATDFPSWERRRNEILHAVQQYEIGPKPDCHDCTITASYVPSASNALQGTLTVNVTRKGLTMTETAAVTLPSSGPGPFPYVVGIAGATGSLPASLFTNVAIVAFDEDQVTVSDNPLPTDGFYTLYPELCAGPTCTVATDFGAGGSNSGQYGAWAWGMSRLLDGIEMAARQASNPLPLDTRHSAVTGCSFAGKEALYDGAFDERIALTIAQENGGGGAPSFRVNREVESPAPPGAALGATGSVEDIDDTDYHWFTGQMFQFNGNNVYKLPIDQHEVMALIAPRALLETGNTDFYWLGNGANLVSARATQQIFNEFGIGDRFGWIIDGNHDHCAVPDAELPEIQAFIDKFLLGQQHVSTDIEVIPNPFVQEETAAPFSLPMGDFSGIIAAADGTPFATDYPYLFPHLDYARWTHWWGTGHPVFPNEWNTGGTMVLEEPTGQLLQLATGASLAGSYALTMPGKHAAATVTVANATLQTDVHCTDGSSYTLTMQLPVSQTFTFAANSKDPAQVAVAGSVTNPGCSAGGPGTAVNSVLTVVGVQDSFAGDGAGPGFIMSDTTDPLNVNFQVNLAGSTGRAPQNPGVTVNPLPANSASPTLLQQF